VLVFQHLDVCFVLLSVYVDFELHETNSLRPTNVALRMQVDATCLCPAAGFAQVLDMLYSKSLSNGSRKYGAHDCQMFVRDLVRRSDLIEASGQLRNQLFELVELRSGDHGRLERVESLGD
jgi:hypothetical protein